LIDFEQTDTANDKLKKERQKRENYYRLIEERQRRILEEDTSRPRIIESDAGIIRIEEDDTQTSVSISMEEFPLYEEEDVIDRSEEWWRYESSRLFAALNESNKQLRDISAAHDKAVIAHNRARTEAEAARLQQEINNYRTQAASEMDKGRLIGNRLAELSEWAEQLAIPLDWIVPDTMPVYDESQQPPDVEVGEETVEEIAVEDYSAEELRNVPDSWWAREMNRLREQERLSQAQLAAHRRQYNNLIAQRDNTETEIQRNQLNNQIDSVVGDINGETALLTEIQDSIDRLVAAARELGKEAALGLVRERQDQ
jgi:hypothetical protein